MSKLEELIQGLCPDGVKYAKIGEVAECVAGATPKTAIAAYWENGTISWMSSGEVNNKVIYETEAKISQEGYDSCSTKMVPPNTVVIALAGQGKTRGTVAITRIELCTNQSLCSIITKDGLLPDFLYHYLSGQYVKLRDISSGDGTRGGLNLKMIRDFYVPLPPLPVQQKIVRILDSFTELTDELNRTLEAELTARRKQYEYFEYKLLFDNDYHRVKLQELCTVNQGLQVAINKRHKKPGHNRYRYITVQFLKNKEEEQYYIENPDTQVICNEDDILVTRTGSTGVVITGVEGCFHNNFFKVNCDKSIIQKYMLCVLKSKFMYNKMLAAASGGSVPDLPHKKFYNLEVPLPPKEKQAEIVSILDRFDALCNDLTSGLPAEIEARQKQYEYYRDKLLKFKSLSRNS